MTPLPFLRLPLWRTALVAGLALVLAPAALLFGQGPLTPPPGVPAATMKRLDEVEARVNLSALNTPGDASSVFVITAPGSYYLTGNVAVTGAGGVVNGIKIYSDNVTLDLNGFTISSTNASAAGNGVLLAGSAAALGNANVTILNGTIKGTTTYTTFSNTYAPGGFANGVGLSAAGVTNGRISGLNVQGIGGAGISFSGGTVEKSNVNTASGTGITASVVTDSTANTTGGTAISANAGSNLVGSTTGTGQDVIVSGSGQPGGDRRTALAQSGTSPIFIASAGSYYLTGNVTVTSGGAINILASNVTLDLNGFTVSSSAGTATGTAILLVNAGGAPKNVTILNGQIASGGTVSGTTFTAGTGFAKGIDATIGLNVRVQNVGVQGVSSNAIDLGTDRASVVSGCTVRAVGGQGIRAGVVSDSSAIGCVGTFAIDAASASNSIGTLVSGSSKAVSVTGQRIAISGAPYTIDQPGSYYLTGNLTVATGNAITITADNVSLDLNGFNITSTSATANGDAININARSGLFITNGTITSGSTVTGSPGTFTAGPGFAGGINWGGAPTNVRVSGVTVIGVSQYGIDLGTDGSCVVQNCVARACGVYGIHAGTISDSSALQCGVSAPMLATTIANSTGSIIGGTVTAMNTAASSTSVASVQTSVNTANSSITTANSAITGVQSSVNTVNTGVATLQTTANAIKAAGDPRTPIVVTGTGGYALNSPGSYYLTSSFTAASNGIVINANNVTLDLNGYTISSFTSPASGTAITITSGYSNIQIRNGNIDGTTSYASGTFTTGGFLDGITFSSTTLNVRIQDVTISQIGGNGIYCSATNAIEQNVLIENCTVSTAAQRGISCFASVRNCIVRDCGGTAISCSTVVGSSGRSYGTVSGASGISCGGALHSSGFTDGATGYGLSAQEATGCHGFGGATGLYAETAMNCTGSFGTASGLTAVTASNCRGVGSGVGLAATNASNCFGQTYGVDASGVGLDVQTTTGVATSCRGVGGGGTSVALKATTAVGCTYTGTASIQYKYLMP